MLFIFLTLEDRKYIEPTNWSDLKNFHSQIKKGHIKYLNERALSQKSLYEPCWSCVFQDLKNSNGLQAFCDKGNTTGRKVVHKMDLLTVIENPLFA
jgi:hypothetical protein